MKLLCKCGNIFDFENNEFNNDEGFELLMKNDSEALIIHCNRCDKTIIFGNTEEEDE